MKLTEAEERELRSLESLWAQYFSLVESIEAK